MTTWTEDLAALAGVPERLRPAVTALPYPDAAKALRVSVRRLHALVQARALRVVTVGDEWCIELAELRRFQAEQES